MTNFAQQVSRAIRILRGNRDESARASHLVVEKDLLMTYERAFLGLAEREKCSQSTFFERKIMSTKTAFKRVALVAAAALAIGGISAVSAYAGTAAGGGTVSLSSSSTTGVIHSAVTTNATFGFTSAATTDAGTLTVALATKPVGSTVSSASLALAGVSISTADTRSISSQVDTLTAAGWVAVTHTSASATDSVTFTPDLPGTYTVTATNNVPGATVATWTVTAVLVTPTASAVTGTYTSVTLNAAAADKNYTITSTGVGTVFYPASPVSGYLTSSGGSELWYKGATPSAANFAGTDTLPFSVYSATAGTQTLTFVGNSTGSFTEVITWAAAPVLSAANSFVAANNKNDIGAGPVGTTGTTLRVTTASADTSITAVGTTPGVPAGGATVGVYNSASTPIVITSDTVSASVSGPGLVSIATLSAITGTPTDGAFTSQGRSVSVAATTGFAIVKLYSDGTIGTSTVTVSDSTTGVVLGTFTVTFYSATIAKLVATTNTNVPIAAVAGFASTATEGINGTTVATGGAPVSVVAYDANGNKIPSASGITVTSGTTSVATAGSPTYDSTNGYIYVNIVPVSEGSTVITFSDTATGLVTATATVWVVSAVAASVVAASDAASYDPGTKVLYTLTAADAAKNPIADGTYTNLLTTSPTSNVALQGLGVIVSPTFAGGVATNTIYSPVNSANVAIAGGVISATAATVATAIQGSTLNEVDFATTGSSDTAANAATDAANEATDAANAATDAANAAADSADAATQAAQDAGDKADAAFAAVTALSQQVTTLLAKVAAVSAALAKISAAIAKLPKK